MHCSTREMTGGIWSARSPDAGNQLKLFVIASRRRSQRQYKRPPLRSTAFSDRAAIQLTPTAISFGRLAGVIALFQELQIGLDVGIARILGLRLMQQTRGAGV